MERQRRRSRCSGCNHTYRQPYRRRRSNRKRRPNKNRAKKCVVAFIILLLAYCGLLVLDFDYWIQGGIFNQNLNPIQQINK